MQPWYSSGHRQPGCVPAFNKAWRGTTKQQQHLRVLNKTQHISYFELQTRVLRGHGETVSLPWHRSGGLGRCSAFLRRLMPWPRGILSDFIGCDTAQHARAHLVSVCIICRWLKGEKHTSHAQEFDPPVGPEQPLPRRCWDLKLSVGMWSPTTAPPA